MHFGSETQPQSAQRMYDSRAATYEDSWHPSYALRFTSYLSISPGDNVLDLCCGTGLNVFAAAEKVGPSGSVIGVDVSDGMLEQARRKQAANPDVGKRCLLLKGDVAKLDDVFAAAGLGQKHGAFDWITCSSAFVLLDNPSAALAHWKTFLKPDGRMAVDIPHEHNLRAGTILERVAKRLGVALPFNRSWVESSESFVKLAVAEGLEVEKYELLERVMGEKTTYYDLGQADEQFGKLVNGSLMANLDVEEFKKMARPLFHDEWAKAAVDGKVEVADALYLYILRVADTNRG
ncbi:S-adenosyl-L-methionine-dependent methyltransferase [Coniochaeta sp. PMI_546]|nr:S-adenosyl-L-methionine-dependent methyltransferase [Coniochaeta sp. PMI_546]